MCGTRGFPSLIPHAHSSGVRPVGMGSPPAKGLPPGMRPERDSSEGSQPPCPGSEDSWADRQMHAISADQEEATCFIYRTDEFGSWGKKSLGNCFLLPGPLSRRRNHPRHWEQMSLFQLALHSSFTWSAGLLDVHNISAPG